MLTPASFYQATRGSLGGKDPNDPRMHVGWRADATETVRPEERTWMSTSEQQPYFSHWQDDEAYVPAIYSVVFIKLEIIEI